MATWDGTAWHPLDTDLGDDSSAVHALAVYNGQLYAGGTFASAGGTTLNGIARWDGSAWQPLDTGVTGTSTHYVSSLMVYQGKLIVAGVFDHAGSLPANGLATWNGTSWGTWGGGVGLIYNGIKAMTTFGNNLIVGGSFSSMGGVTASNVATWNGTSWSQAGAGIPTGQYTPTSVDSFVVYNGQLIAGGNFVYTDPAKPQMVASWNGVAGAVWQPVGAGLSYAPGFFQDVSTMTVFNNQLIVGGRFDHAGGVPALSVASWNGSSWSNVGSGVGSLPPDNWIADAADAFLNFNGHLLVGGVFDSVGDIRVHSIAQWSGSAWSALPSVMHNYPSTIYCFKNWGGRMLAGGDFYFTDPDTYVTKNLMAWNGTETSSQFGDTDGAVRVMAVFSRSFPISSDMYVAGDFTHIEGNGLSAGTAVNRIAHYNSLTVNVNGPGMGAGFNNTVRAIERFNNVVYAAGDFTASGDNATTLNHIASWNGTTWLPLGSGVNGPVNALRVYNGFLYAGGSFTSAAGLGSGGLARWNGTAWSIVGGNFLGTVYSLELYNGQLVIAGNYPGISGSPSLAQYNGTNYSTIGTGGANGAVRCACVGPDGNLYIGGDFTSAGGVASANHLARWNGSAWSAVGGGANDSVYALAPYHNEVQAGGSFTAVRNGVIASPGYARFSVDGVPWIAAALSTPTPVCVGHDVSLSMEAADGYGGLAFTWRRNGVPITMGTTAWGTTIATDGEHLDLHHVHAQDQGSYDMVLSNGCGSSTSNAVTLSINSADFNGDGDLGTDADISAFFACIAGSCCPTCGSADFNGDGDLGTDTDIEAFFRVLGGGPC